MTVPELNRGSLSILPWFLAAVAIAFAGQAQGETRTVFGIGGGEAKNSVVEDYRFALFHSDFDLFTQFEWDVPLDGSLTITAGRGDGAFGKVELLTFEARVDWTPGWEGLELGCGYRAATARLEEINLGPGVRPVGLLEQRLCRAALEWEDAAIGLSVTHLWSSPAPEKQIGNDFCARWTGIQACGSWTNRGSSWSVMLLWETGTRIQLPWRKR